MLEKVIKRVIASAGNSRIILIPLPVGHPKKTKRYETTHQEKVKRSTNIHELGPCSPMAETGDLKSLQCGFESHLGHEQ